MGPATEDEELFNADIDIGKQNYSWADKYKPRKPRFYNRVHTVSLLFKTTKLIIFNTDISVLYEISRNYEINSLFFRDTNGTSTIRLTTTKIIHLLK